MNILITYRSVKSIILKSYTYSANYSVFNLKAIDCKARNIYYDKVKKWNINEE